MSEPRFELLDEDETFGPHDVDLKSDEFDEDYDRDTNRGDDFDRAVDHSEDEGDENDLQPADRRIPRFRIPTRIRIPRFNSFRRFRGIRNFRRFRGIRNFRRFRGIRNFRRFRGIRNFRRFRGRRNFRRFRGIRNFQRFRGRRSFRRLRGIRRFRGRYNRFRGRYNRYRGRYNRLRGRYNRFRGRYNRYRGRYGSRLRGRWNNRRGYRLVNNIRKANNLFRKRPRGGLKNWFKRTKTWFKTKWNKVQAWKKGVEDKLAKRISMWGTKNIPKPVQKFWAKIKPYASKSWRAYRSIKDLGTLYGIYRYVQYLEGRPSTG